MRIQIFAPGGDTILEPHIGQTDAGPVRSKPHFGHLLMDVIRGDYSTNRVSRILTEVMAGVVGH
jgi:hypothetical protein